MDQSRSRELADFQLRNSPHFRELEGSLQHSKQPTTCPCSKPEQSSPSSPPIPFLEGLSYFINKKIYETPDYVTFSSLQSFISISPTILLSTLFYKFFHMHSISGFGGLGVECWPLVPKFAGSKPAEDVGFLGRKIPQQAFLRRESKAVGLVS